MKTPQTNKNKNTWEGNSSMYNKKTSNSKSIYLLCRIFKLSWAHHAICRMPSWQDFENHVKRYYRLCKT
jgi:hypothetical protein